MKEQKVVVSIPDTCGGHPIIKGHRIEVHNLVNDMTSSVISPDGWIEIMSATDWLTPDEVIDVLEFCADRLCAVLDVFCCNCTLSGESLCPSDPDGDERTEGWSLAHDVLVRLGRRSD